MVIEEPLTLACGKGRMLERTLIVFERLGYDMEPIRAVHRERKMIGLEGEGRLRVLLAKDSDVPVYVEHGAADIGIAGRDVVRERESDVLVPLLLGELLPESLCRLVLAAPRSLGAHDLRQHHSLRIATKYPNLARAYATQSGLSAEILGLSGQVELAAASGLADVIVDIVQSGTTLRENNLVEIDTILPCEACLIVNRAAQKLRPTEIRALIGALEELAGFEDGEGARGFA